MRHDRGNHVRHPGLKTSMRSEHHTVSITADRTALTDPARLAAVRRYEILDAPTDGQFDTIAAAAAAVCGTPIATVSIVDADRVWFAAAKGLDGVAQVGTEPGLCASAKPNRSSAASSKAHEQKCRAGTGQARYGRPR